VDGEEGERDAPGLGLGLGYGLVLAGEAVLAELLRQAALLPLEEVAPAGGNGPDLAGAVGRLVRDLDGELRDVTPLGGGEPLMLLDDVAAAVGVAVLGDPGVVLVDDARTDRPTPLEAAAVYSYAPLSQSPQRSSSGAPAFGPLITLTMLFIGPV
jgi:hypothetical protein